ncbi:nucleotide sugar dehydrogenase [Planococcus antarcticus DSM 14505]|uniref:UDP-glucose 6-dehydrogenase n=1 Tax=Planococcus antarcticus DSM 14505 TaxID=1185653 RepID=A0A1C7DG38_9BACL|nr:UDP-glucose/GDP-mannose dehydrogenase family protein [Planococcus antarcticus]ANU10193.1 UDP-glucose 6-dehydrogenase [Planococcus antarcticus DSM 14505]EIM06143.1 nucleotide sugar dehydrogenase [Planococcus antarcticus DSM 14505]
MRIAVIGTGYVGLVTGVSLSEIGHHITCIDVNEDKVAKMQNGISPIYEPGLSELMTKNINEKRLSFTTDHQEGLQQAEIVYIAVGTPENIDGSADLSFVAQAAKDIAGNVEHNIIVVTKSTVPVGTNDMIKDIIQTHLPNGLMVEVVSNPEFLKEGSAIHDSFHGDRIVIGADSEHAFSIIEQVNQPFGVPIFKTDIKSAEMIKYASNAFLATKISFINEISNICELLGANIENVSTGMGLDQRIGSQFLKAGIGYGGSCFPKDTKALIQIAGNVEYEFELLKGVVNVNKKQQGILISKLNDCLPVISGKKIAVLGLSFKPNTDDMRESASILVTEELIKQGAKVVAYDPIAMENAKSILNPLVQYADSIEDAVENSDAALILTDWSEIKNVELAVFNKMKKPLVIDGRNCFALKAMENNGIDYHSIGRPVSAKLIEAAPI